MIQYSGVSVSTEKIHSSFPLKESLTVQILSLGVRGSHILPPRVRYTYYIAKPRRPVEEGRVVSPQFMEYFATCAGCLNGGTPFFCNCTKCSKNSEIYRIPRVVRRSTPTEAPYLCQGRPSNPNPRKRRPAGINPDGWPEDGANASHTQNASAVPAGRRGRSNARLASVVLLGKQWILIKWPWRFVSHAAHRDDPCARCAVLWRANDF